MTKANRYPGVHWRVSLRLRGRKGQPVERERVVHKDSPVPDAGMQRTCRKYPRRASILAVICWDGDECPDYLKNGR